MGSPAKTAAKATDKAAKKIGGSTAKVTQTPHATGAKDKAKAPAPAATPAAPPLDPNASTVVTVEEKPEVEQEVVLKDAHYDQVLAEIDTIFLIDTLEPVRKHLVDKVKGILLENKFKYGDGNFSLAQVKVNKKGREINSSRALALLLRKKVPFEKLVEVGAICFDGKALAEVLTGEEIATLQDETRAKSPAMTIDALPATVPPSVVEAIQRLAGVDSSLLVVPEKPKKGEKGKEATAAAK